MSITVSCNSLRSTSFSSSAKTRRLNKSHQTLWIRLYTSLPGTLCGPTFYPYCFTYFFIKTVFMWNFLHFFSPIRYGWLEIAERLLKKRNVRMINLQNNQGKTALHFACHEGHEQIAQLLLVEGATIER